jgi:hypothetical protein
MTDSILSDLAGTQVRVYADKTPWLARTTTAAALLAENDLMDPSSLRELLLNMVRGAVQSGTLVRPSDGVRVRFELAAGDTPTDAG